MHVVDQRCVFLSMILRGEGDIFMAHVVMWGHGRSIRPYEYAALHIYFSAGGDH